ncbi:hypothetical protein [Miltoncostaea oceani]|uniref:hypothetical protein n=1 Tax=Miltoncostaea oceani TaxID=2843216 RepID=UPI001C3CFF4F|nr:hypothetical protein [Miltoncostaea oceani]
MILPSLGAALSAAADQVGHPAAGVALYPSAGADTMPLIQLSKARCLAAIGDGPQAVGVFAYVDNQPVLEPRAQLAFKDARTSIETAQSIPVSIAGRPAWMLSVRVTSHSERWSTVCAVIRIEADNSVVASWCEKEGWRPDIFIGVCDGCGAFGGNQGRCVNALHGSGFLGPQTPDWWITDHFPSAEPPRFEGSHVLSTEDGFPYALRRVARMGGWPGGYGRWHPEVRGSTLYRVERVGETLSIF